MEQKIFKESIMEDAYCMMNLHQLFGKMTDIGTISYTVEPLLKDTLTYAIKDPYQSPKYHATAIFYL